MAIYSLGFAKAAATTGTAYAMIRPPSTLAPSIREIGVFNETAVSSSVGLVRNATTGTPSTSTLVQEQGLTGTAGQTNIDTAWSAAATVGSNYLRQIVLPATIGAGIVWYFGSYELQAKAGAASQLCLWNFGAGTSAAVRIYVVVDE